ncbi:cupin domain-containing protein [Anianabacter salinae]|uniref:cupin domain-containing protein n=1 Tax=Anianabacter salinae TaxID=2851023 RepID=UPI00225E4933|nr:cupin domain-containing protein [Anianabacter salinae]MBV0911656.1 cupin domain-containing protein [Anianabacter salinae]
MLKTLFAAATTAVIATSAFADTHADEHIVMADDIAWQDVVPGIQLALGWGDLEAGDDIWLIRMEPGAALPSHAHTNDYWGMTVQGTWVHIHEDGSETATTVGDYALVEGGVFHADRCDGDVPCIGLLDFDGERDAIFPE